MPFLQSSIVHKSRLSAARAWAAAHKSTLVVGVTLAGVWALHAAADYVPGTGYVRLPLLFATAAAILAWRLSNHAVAPRGSNNSGMTVGLCCWFAAATLSTILNWQTDDVVLTYTVVFLAGAAVFVALSGITCTAAMLDIAVVGLAIGTLFPLIGGLRAFYGEWGTPDATTTVTAWQDLLRMNAYTDATFGNRGNTAGFLLLITPLFIAIALDSRRRLALRGLCAALLLPITLNLMILQVRSAFVTLPIAIVLIGAFKLGSRRIPVVICVLLVGWTVFSRLEPDAGMIMADRVVPAITIDTEGDESVQGRAAAIQEGVKIFGRNWLLGIGPGGALSVHSMSSAHQFHVQQGMETGILGLIGSVVFSMGLFISLLRTLVRGRGDERNDLRFMLLIGPTAFVIDAMIANAALNNGSVNTWTVLMASMLALAPRFQSVPLRVPSASPTPRPVFALDVAAADGVR